MTAYISRAATGGGVVIATLQGTRYFVSPLWLVRLNICLAIITIALTIAIAYYKEDAWADWLESGPFRLKGSSKTPYSNEKETMIKFSELILDMKP